MYARSNSSSFWLFESHPIARERQKFQARWINFREKRYAAEEFDFFDDAHDEYSRSNTTLTQRREVS